MIPKEKGDSAGRKTKHSYNIRAEVPLYHERKVAHSPPSPAKVGGIPVPFFRVRVNLSPIRITLMQSFAKLTDL
jgi:hypothetical protein